MSGCKCVGARIDYLQVAFRVELDDDVMSYIRSRAMVAQVHSTAAAELQRVAPLDFEDEHQGIVLNLTVNPYTEAWAAQVRALRGADRFELKNRLCTVIVDERAPIDDPIPGTRVTGWTLEITFSGAVLVDHPWRLCMREAWAIACAFGRVLEGRVRRLDLCADFEGFGDLSMDLRESLVTRSRCKVVPHEAGVALDVGDPQLEEFSSRDVDHCWTHTLSERVTGFTISPGNDVMARIYDKSYELEGHHARTKRAREEAQWTENGWTGTRVIRIEFQLRGAKALRELDLRELAIHPDMPAHMALDSAIKHLDERIDAAWGYLVGGVGESLSLEGMARGWIRMVDRRTNERRTRCETDPRWNVVRGVVFVVRQPPAKRVRECTFARSAQALGCVLSILGVHDRLGVPVRVAEVHERVASPERALAASVEPEQAEFMLRVNLLRLFDEAADVIAHDLIDTYQGNAIDAIEHLLVKWGSARARNWMPARAKRFPAAAAPGIRKVGWVASKGCGVAA